MHRSMVGVVAIMALALIANAAGAADKSDKSDKVEEVPFEEGKAPPQAKDGEIWCLVTKPSQYKTVTEQVQVRAATFYYETLPPKYEWREEKVLVEPEKKQAVVIPAQYKSEVVKQLVKEQHTVYEIVPAQYECVEEDMVVRAEGESLDVQGEQYKTESEKVLVEPARVEWKKVDCDDKGVIIQRRESKDDCYTLIEIPAKYQTITKYVKSGEIKESKQSIASVTKKVKVCKLVKDAEVKKTVVPAEYREVEKQVVASPAKVNYETIPARYETIKKLVQVGEESKVKVEVPAKSETITKQVLESPAQLVWRKRRGDPVKKYGSIPGELVQR